MATSQQILVRNMAANPAYFFVFQQQATFTMSSSQAKICSSSLGCQEVGNYNTTGAQITFGLDAQVYAGALSTMAPLPPSSLNALITISACDMETSSSASQPVNLSAAQPMNFTEMSINPLGLSTPTTNTNLQAATFGIAVPPYTQTQPPELYCGVAVKMANGSIVLSSYVAPMANQTISCEPKAIYYVKAGYYPTGSNFQYDTSNTAECNFSSGLSTIIVTYNSDGTFAVGQGN